MLQRWMVTKFAPPDEDDVVVVSPAYTCSQYLTELRANFATTYLQNKEVFDTITNHFWMPSFT
jgi:hypothetical protein